VQTELPVRLRPSALAALFILLAHGATLLLVFRLPIGPLLHYGAAIVIAFSAAWGITRVAFLRGPGAVRAFRVTADRRVDVQEAGGGTTRCKVMDSTVVAGFLTIIHLYAEEGPQLPWRLRTVLILPDMLPADEHRRLRVLLRMGTARNAA
jgi:hypothetical protein